MRRLILPLAVLATIGLPASASAQWCTTLDERPARAMSAPIAQPVPLAPGQRYEITVAIETDAALRDLLGSTDAVREYVRQLVEYVGRITDRELSTRLSLGHVSLWEGSDPWPEADIVTRLRAVQAHWQAQHANTPRAVVLMISAVRPWQGAAFTDALCDTGRGYAIAQGLTGDIEVDALLVAHELGHTLGSPHSHCYGGLGGPDPIDACWGRDRSAIGACHVGTVDLPGLGSLTGGEPGQQTGTLMSYCGYVRGGTDRIDPADVAPTYGRGHPFGLRAERAPDWMRSTIERTAAEQLAAGQPQCVRVIDDLPDPRQVPTLSAIGLLVMALAIASVALARLAGRKIITQGDNHGG